MFHQSDGGETTSRARLNWLTASFNETLQQRNIAYPTPITQESMAKFPVDLQRLYREIMLVDAKIYFENKGDQEWPLLQSRFLEELKKEDPSLEKQIREEGKIPFSLGEKIINGPLKEQFTLLVKSYTSFRKTTLHQTIGIHASNADNAVLHKKSVAKVNGQGRPSLETIEQTRRQSMDKMNECVEELKKLESRGLEEGIPLLR